ncbi:MAG: PstS family phosphate ABC transporter substrate-binding protein [Chloroflexi bacterium]|nr:PstS family phosphate ABC transporter substrate-binding protein [Chloroflexota bacterium]
MKLNMCFPGSRWLIAVASIAVLAVAACGGGEDDGQDNGGAATLSGLIEIDGSSTVFPISQAVAEEFNKLNRDVQVPVGVSGTGGGFKRFVTGETTISDASRPIKDSEAAEAAENGVEFIELTVAFDGLSVLVHPDNSFVECLTTAELSDIWAAGSDIDRWNEVRAEWPDEEIDLFGPDTESGTFDYFTEEINGETGASRPDYTAAVDDNVLVQGIAGEKGSLGYFGYAYYAENTDKLKLVAVDSGSGCVLPTNETIADGSYSPLSRPLLIYVNTSDLQKPEVRALIDFYIDNAAELAAEVGYVALPEAEYEKARQLVSQQ